MRTFFFLLLLSVNAQAAGPDKTIPPYPVQVELLSTTQAGSDYLVLAFENHEGWHTYWKNPGDSGKSIEVELKVDEETIPTLEKPWPGPQTFAESGSIITYGYQGRYALFYALPQGWLTQHQGRSLSAKLQWLVCKHICIPGKATLEGKISPQLSLSAPQSFRYPRGKIKSDFLDLPQEVIAPPDLTLELYAHPESQKLYLFYYLAQGRPQALAQGQHNLLYPYGFAAPPEHNPFGFLHEKIYSDESGLYGLMEIEWDGAYLDPPQAFPSQEGFETPKTFRFLLYHPSSQLYFDFKKTFESFKIQGLQTKRNRWESLTPLTADSSPSPSPPTYPFYYYLLFALLGGFILNFMPCVLPVITLKLFGLIQHSHHSRRQILAHNSMYSLGICFSFLVLASVVFALKEAGTQIGWGFHMQSPTFLGIMILVLLIFAANLWGLFEFKTPFAKQLGNVKLQQGLSSDFFGGVLATILSTPCSAPFLGTALTFAFTTTTANIFLMFLSVGLGLASPFLLTALFPASIRLLPRPGAWMITFKKVMGLSLVATALWLGMVMKSILLPTDPIVGRWEPWSEEKMLAESEHPVFVDFTATWCLTCQANKVLVLNTEKFQTLMARHQVRLMVADWTKYDPVIADFLQRHGHVGVPVYFLKTPDGKLYDLGETISTAEAEQLLDKGEIP